MSDVPGHNISPIEENICNVDGININYAKTGKGDHTVLLLPGAIGSSWTHFKPQLENLDKEKFTIIAWDPPGYGKSRPPNRNFREDFLRRDAELVFKLMKNLGYNKFSLLGWCQGATTAIMIAAEHPECIRKMILNCAQPYITTQEIENYEKVSSLDKFPEIRRDELFAEYGEKYARDIWSVWLDSIRFVYHKKAGNLCKEDVPKIKCSTLITIGERDETKKEHCDFLKDNIKNSRVKIFESGNHYFHLIHPDRFNKIVEEFLAEDDTSVED